MDKALSRLKWEAKQYYISKSFLKPKNVIGLQIAFTLIEGYTI